MMRLNKISIACLLAAVVLLAGCKDDDVPALEYQQQGHIKGTLVGIASDKKTAINQSFEYTQYAPGYYPEGSAYSYYRVESGGAVDIRIMRQNLSTGSYLSINFSLSSETDTSPDGINYSFQYITTNDPVIHFSMESGINNDVTVTGFSFDRSSGHVKGNFTLSGADNSTGNNAIITGDIDVVVKEVIQ